MKCAIMGDVPFHETNENTVQIKIMPASPALESISESSYIL